MLAALALTLAAAGTVPAPRLATDDLRAALGAHVRAGRVDYAALARDRAALDRFVAWVAATSPESHPELFPTRERRLAYWIDAYNALVLRAIVDAWPVSSVRDLAPDFGAFRLPRRVGGRARSLDAIEKDVLRGLGDPRIHFALNCGAVSCPALSAEPWAGPDVDARLDAAVRRALADPAHLRIDPATRTVSVSRLFEWYAEDLGPPLAWIDRYGPAEGRPASWEGWRVAFLDWDWSLNGE